MPVLAGHPEAKLHQRPPKGDWSVLEHLQHLLFHEQGLSRFTPGGLQLSPLGLANEGLMRKFPPVGTAKPSGSAEVLDVWATAHKSYSILRQSEDPEVRVTLAKTLRHLRNHVEIIERLLRRA